MWVENTWVSGNWKHLVSPDWTVLFPFAGHFQGINIAAIVAPTVTLGVLAIVLAVLAWIFLVVKKKRQTEGTYRPSAEEQSGTSCTAAPDALKLPKEERLIWMLALEQILFRTCVRGSSVMLQSTLKGNHQLVSWHALNASYKTPLRKGHGCLDLAGLDHFFCTTERRISATLFFSLQRFRLHITSSLTSFILQWITVFTCKTDHLSQM